MYRLFLKWKMAFVSLVFSNMITVNQCSMINPLNNFVETFPAATHTGFTCICHTAKHSLQGKETRGQEGKCRAYPDIPNRLTQCFISTLLHSTCLIKIKFNLSQTVKGLTCVFNVISHGHIFTTYLYLTMDFTFYGSLRS